MSFSLKNILSPSPSSTASLVDGHLILSLPDAIDPVIWRMALDKIGTATFGIKTSNDNKTTKLILKPKKGTVEIIATFDSKKEATTALMLTSNALQTQSAQTINSDSSERRTSTTQDRAVKPTPMAAPPAPKAETQKWSIAILGALIVIGLYVYLTTLIPDTNIGFEPSTPTSFVTTSPQETTGVPISADDFLNGL